MNIENWTLYYKIHESKNIPTYAQMCYEPRINPEGNIFCMNFCYPCEYQINQIRLSYIREHVEFMFQRECKYLEIFKNRPYAPEVIDITNNKIFIKWYKVNCNNLIYETKNLKTDWLKDISSIIYDQVSLGYIKATLYPHSHYYDDNGQMHSIDFYATVEKDNPFLKVDSIKSMIGLDTDRFKQAITDDLVNIEMLFKSGLLQYGKWPENLTQVYTQLYEQ